ncbi:MAG: type I glutamate--ammonia ligase [Candidatus Berkelbacteria bacterium]|nr:MAG: type I glutamate--ammonia ligase [Candidatus Berkelbacteria bacterium]QQG51745.1 MAG: type I glutamate--ammonia ligase [Candidatus Berkelbacteria bacterium]
MEETDKQRPARHLKGAPDANAKSAVEFVTNHNVRSVDVRFTDLFGKLQHFTMSVRDFTEELFDEGVGFDGSSIRGFQSINESDMLLVPDPTTVHLDPFMNDAAVVFCRIEDPLTRERYSRDPRYVAEKCIQYLRSSGVADQAFIGPEPEFFVFNELTYETAPQRAGFCIRSDEAHWQSHDGECGGYTTPAKGGYFPCPPRDKLHLVRQEIVDELEGVGIEVEVHHHEVASAGQCEIDMRFRPLVEMADQVQLFKYIVHNVAADNGMVACFMPKPLSGDNGSGMHIHISLWKDNESLMYDEQGYAGLSDEARYFVGGVLKHAPALLAFCAPTTNSYRRLVPGYEAPINLMYSQRNRSACVRVPMYSKSPKSKRIEFRAPDPTANPYLAFAACVMAGIDGIQNRIEPPKPLDKDLYELPPEEKGLVRQTPGSLRAVLEALAADNDFLTQGDVFTKDLIDIYIKLKLEECDRVDLKPHPEEFAMYADS